LGVIVNKSEENNININDILSMITYPEYLDEDFDWYFLWILIAGSFSSSWGMEYILDEKRLILYVDVTSGERHIRKYLDDLWGFQIVSMYKIYLEELLNLFYLKETNKDEAKIFEKEKEKKIDYCLAECERILFLRKISEECSNE
jgi:hypothetical protein